MLEPRIIPAHSGHVMCVQFSADCKSIYSAGFSGELKQWSVQDLSLIRELKGHTKSVNGLILKSASELISLSLDGNIIIWNNESSEQKFKHQYNQKGINCGLINHAGDTLFISTNNEFVSSLDISSFKLTKSLPTNKKQFGIRAISNDDSQIFVSTNMGSFVILDSLELKQVREIKAHQTVTTSIQFFNNGENALSSGYEGEIKLWDCKNWKEVWKSNFNSRGFNPLSVSENEKLFAVAKDYGVLLYDLEKLTLISELRCEAKGNYGINFSADNNYLALASADKKVRIWNL